MHPNPKYFSLPLSFMTFTLSSSYSSVKWGCQPPLSFLQWSRNPANHGISAVGREMNEATRREICFQNETRFWARWLLGNWLDNRVKESLIKPTFRIFMWGHYCTNACGYVMCKMLPWPYIILNSHNNGNFIQNQNCRYCIGGGIQVHLLKYCMEGVSPFSFQTQSCTVYDIRTQHGQ